MRIDGGDWIPVTLVPGPSSLAWTQWYFEWTPENPGVYTIEVRATDSSGFLQYLPVNRFSPPFDLTAKSAVHQIVIEVN